MKIEVIAFGKLKEKYWTDAVQEYRTRMSRFCQLQITELKEVVVYNEDSVKEIAAALHKEQLLLLKQVKPEDMLITLAIDGKVLTSEGLAKQIKQDEISRKKIIFVIGSSYGLAPEVYKRANMSISFSAMTFPHQLMRVILVEQLYRAFKINTNEKYHK